VSSRKQVRSVAVVAKFTIDAKCIVSPMAFRGTHRHLSTSEISHIGLQTPSSPGKTKDNLLCHSLLLDCATEVSFSQHYILETASRKISFIFQPCHHNFFLLHASYRVIVTHFLFGGTKRIN
jgi:hypothetical protein